MRTLKRALLDAALALGITVAAVALVYFVLPEGI